MSSVDGRLLNERWTKPTEGTPAMAPFKVYATISQELGTDAWMFGKNTLRAMFPYKFAATGHSLHGDTPRVFVGERRSRRLFITIDPDADIFYSSSVIRGDNIVVVLGPNATEEYLAHLRERRVSYLVVADTTDLRHCFEMIHTHFGVESVSVQGGGIINGALLEAGLIDELSLVIYPGVDGLHGIPSIFDYVGGKTDLPAEGQSLRLVSVTERDHGVVWLRYKFESAYNK